MIKDIKTKEDLENEKKVENLAQELRIVKTQLWKAQEDIRELERQAQGNDSDLNSIARRTLDLEREQLRTDGFKKLAGVGMVLMIAVSILTILLIYAKACN